MVLLVRGDPGGQKQEENPEKIELRTLPFSVVRWGLSRRTGAGRDPRKDYELCPVVLE